MTDVTQAGLDRRSLIKKGLAAGGVVAAAPVITTFNAPAFAASPPGFRIRFVVTLGVNVLNVVQLTGVSRVAAGDDACGAIEADWDMAAPDPGATEIPIDVNAGGMLLTGGHLTFTLQGAAAANYNFFAARRSGCASAVLGGDTATFNLAPLTLLVNEPIYLIVN